MTHLDCCCCRCHCDCSWMLRSATSAQDQRDSLAEVIREARNRNHSQFLNYVVMLLANNAVIWRTSRGIRNVQTVNKGSRASCESRKMRCRASNSETEPRSRRQGIRHSQRQFAMADGDAPRMTKFCEISVTLLARFRLGCKAQVRHGRRTFVTTTQSNGRTARVEKPGLVPRWIKGRIYTLMSVLHHLDLPWSSTSDSVTA